jgi:hypothetical protein
MTDARERRLAEWADLVDEDVSESALAADGDDRDGGCVDGTVEGLPHGGA